MPRSRPIPDVALVELVGIAAADLLSGGTTLGEKDGARVIILQLTNKVCGHELVPIALLLPDAFALYGKLGNVLAIEQQHLQTPEVT